MNLEPNHDPNRIVETEEARRQGRSTEPLKVQDGVFSVFVFDVPDEVSSG